MNRTRKHRGLEQVSFVVGAAGVACVVVAMFLVAAWAGWLTLGAALIGADVLLSRPSREDVS